MIQPIERARRTSGAPAAALLGALALAALPLRCRAEPPPAARFLELRQIRPENREGVYLNERLVLHFSEPLDPTSVNSASVRIALPADAGALGVLARGRLEVDEERLEFIPDPVLARDLADGGYVPGATYFVELIGFPRLDGLRGRSGATLRQNLRWEFRAVAVDDPRGGRVFEDASPTRGSTLRLATERVHPLEPILLACEEPIDPSTVFSEDFELYCIDPVAGNSRARDERRIPLRARLVRNQDPGAGAGPDLALIELTPMDRLLESGAYRLKLDAAKLRLRDFSGHPLWLRRGGSAGFPAKVEVEAADRPIRDPTAQYVESFASTATRSAEAPDGYDGTAAWSGNGRVELLWPAAAGDGSDGDVALAPQEQRRDVHSIALTLAADVRCELEPAPGRVVLRSQGRGELLGTLARGGPPRAADAALDELLWPAARRSDLLTASRESGGDVDPRSPAMFEELRALDSAVTVRLSGLLERLRELDSDVTVLIAGGDLVIGERIECATPLLLVAGGRIRLLRKDALRAPAVYYFDHALEPLRFVPPAARSATQSAQRCAFRLELDAPQENILRRPLRVAVMSTSLPPLGRALRWYEGPNVTIHSGLGSARIRYVGEHSGNGPGTLPDALVDDPVVLTDCPTLRLLIELEMPAASSAPGADLRWDPPWVDDVALEYQSDTPRGGR